MRKSLSNTLVDLGAIARKTKGHDNQGSPDILTGGLVKNGGLDRE
jgi:hypothetical protein